MEGMMGRKTMMMKWSFRCFFSFFSLVFIFAMRGLVHCSVFIT